MLHKNIDISINMYIYMLSKMIEHFIFKGFQGCLKITKKTHKAHVFFYLGRKIVQSQKEWPKLTNNAMIYRSSHDFTVQCKMGVSPIWASFLQWGWKNPLNPWIHGRKGPPSHGIFPFPWLKSQDVCFSGAAWRMIMYMSNAMHLQDATKWAFRIQLGRKVRTPFWGDITTQLPP